MTAFPLLLLASVISQTDATASNRWEPQIRKFEKDDQRTPPEKGGKLFVGSSSIRLWDLDKFFPGENFVNRGFGGSQIEDVNRYFDRIVLPYEPRAIVFYAGDNDLAAKKTPERVLADFKIFAERTRKEFPETKIGFVAVKPSVRRWEGWAEIQKANALVREYCESRETLHYIDIVPPMLGDDGMPKVELLAKDGLHLSEKGYAVWTAAVRESGVLD